MGLTALVLAATASLAVLDARGSPTGTPTARETLHVVERLVTVEVIDLGPSGDSVGDLLAFHNPVFDAANASEVGTAQGSCVRTVPGTAWECMWTVLLEEGQLTTAGPFYDAAVSVVTMTGGTGAYLGASGQMRLEAHNAEGIAYDFIYELTTAGSGATSYADDSGA